MIEYFRKAHVYIQLNNGILEKYYPQMLIKNLAQN